MAEISEIDWAQHIMMDYAQNMRKDPTKAKKITFRRFIDDVAFPFSKRGIYNIMSKFDKTGSIKDSYD